MNLTPKIKNYIETHDDMLEEDIVSFVDDAYSKNILKSYECANLVSILEEANVLNLKSDLQTYCYKLKQHMKQVFNLNLTLTVETYEYFPYELTLEIDNKPMSSFLVDGSYKVDVTQHGISITHNGVSSAVKSWSPLVFSCDVMLKHIYENVSFSSYCQCVNEKISQFENILLECINSITYKSDLVDCVTSLIPDIEKELEKCVKSPVVTLKYKTNYLEVYYSSQNTKKDTLLLDFCYDVDATTKLPVNMEENIMKVVKNKAENLLRKQTSNNNIVSNKQFRKNFERRDITAAIASSGVNVNITRAYTNKYSSFWTFKYECSGHVTLRDCDKIQKVLETMNLNVKDVTCETTVDRFGIIDGSNLFIRINI